MPSTTVGGEWFVSPRRRLARLICWFCPELVTATRVMRRLLPLMFFGNSVGNSVRSDRLVSCALVALAATTLAFAQTPAPKFLELADPEFTEVTADAIIKLPPLDSHERAMLGSLVQMIPLGPTEYSRGDLMAITGGRIIRCEVMADHLTVEVPAFKEDLAGAISILGGILRNVRLDDSAASAALDDADPWASILHGPLAPGDGLKLRKGELEEFYHRVFRPEAVTVAVSGPFAIDAAQKAWDQTMGDWQVPRLLRPWAAADPIPPGSPKINAVEIDGPEIDPDSPDLSSSLLSLFALGCGKGGSLFRLAREEDALSYRQEAVLWPTAKGWLPRLLVASSGLKDSETAGENLKKQLLADVSAWTETDRMRAAGLAEGVLIRGVPLSPFYFRPDRPVTGAPADRAFLEAYWLSKTGLPWNPAGLVDGMKGVSLEALKASATRLLKDSKVVIQTAKPGE